MKKLIWTISLLLVLALAAFPALAATSVTVDGKDYIFYGDQSVYQADGKTFIVEGDSIRIQEAGKQDRVLPLYNAANTTVIQDTAAHAVESQSNHATAVSEDAVSAAAFDAGASTTVVTTSDSSYTHAFSSTEITENNLDRGISYDQYAEFGLNYDAATDILYYQGQRVRIFTDAYPIDASGYAAVEHCDLAGVIDVEAQRDLTKIQYNTDGSYDPGGTLTGLRVLSDAEFANRDLSPWTSPERSSTTYAYSGEPMTPQEKAAFYAPYAEVGVIYDASTDQLLYQGKTVRAFLDVRQTNGEGFSSGLFKGSMTSFTNDSGEIDISILRDYASPDAQGDGKLIGVRVENE